MKDKLIKLLSQLGPSITIFSILMFIVSLVKNSGINTWILLLSIGLSLIFINYVIKNIKKKSTRRLIPAYILSFATSFMLLINEPIVMYATNKEEFGFDIFTIIAPLLIVSFILFVILALIFTGIYYLDKKILKKIPIYKITLVGAFILFIFLYIQGNYLIGSLPPLDGSTVTWSSFTKENIVSLILIIILFGIYVFSIFKFKFTKVIKVSTYLSIAICAMLLVSLITVSISNNVLENKRVIYISTDNINEASKNKNFFIILLDQVDSKIFNETLTNSKYKETFNDFTYFPNTLGAYPFTRDSIPFVLSGKWNENTTTFREHYNNAMDTSPLMNNLEKQNYKINLYEYKLRWTTDGVKKVANVVDFEDEITSTCFARQELKYVSFKYLPYFLKKYSKMDYFDFDYCKKTASESSIDWNNYDYYQTIKNNKLEVIDDNYFSFVHLQGGHYPFDVDENVEKTSNGNYESLLKASMNIVDTFIKRLKENNLYDNSVIVVLADHGYNPEGDNDRQNPILYIKGINEKHSSMNVSNKPVSYDDLMDAYKDLLDNKKSNELFANISNDRERRYLWYFFNAENHIVEYSQKGDASDESTLKPTGRTFDRK